ncbi:MAG: hypothetical protein JO312_15430, partial [Hyphomicrobiales bacterium]|nr:hypothetical protein [Hyphomicrobiales bacterium]
AHHDAPVRTVHVRVGELDGKLYLDLGDAAWRAVEIDKSGWRIVDRADIRFRRSPDMRALPEPVRGGSIEDLRPLLNISADDGDDDFILATAYLLAGLSGRGPYPVMVVAGEQGTAKSTRSALLSSVIDPRRPILRSLPRDERDLFVAARNRHVLAFDNVSGLRTWLSDAFCRIASGAGFGTRQLYSDDEEALFDGARPITCNGIEDVVSRPDLAERSLFSVCEPIADENRRSEDEIWQAFAAAHASVLGALLDAVSTGLRNLPSLKPPALPRMADFAKWAMACEPALWKEGDFLRAYAANILGAVESVLEASPVAGAVRNLMAARQGQEWRGLASDLLIELSGRVDDQVYRSETWPKTPRALSNRLRRASSFLRKTGIHVVFAREGHARARQIVLTAYPPKPGPEDRPKFASASSAPSASDPNTLNSLDPGADAKRTQNERCGRKPNNADAKQGNRPDAADAKQVMRTQSGRNACEFASADNALKVDDNVPDADDADANLRLLAEAQNANSEQTENRPLTVDDVEIVYCTAHAEAETLVAEMLADAGKRPIALDVETFAIASERQRFKALRDERDAINEKKLAAGRALRAADKAGKPSENLQRALAVLEAELKVSDKKVEYAESAGLDPHRSRIRLIQAYGGGARCALLDVVAIGPRVFDLLQGLRVVAHNAAFELAHLGHAGVELGQVHDSMQAVRLLLGRGKSGLAAGVTHYCKVTLEKGTRDSDWLSPVLNDAQLHYAARDVIWLWRLCEKVFPALAASCQNDPYKIHVAATKAVARLNLRGVALDRAAHAETLRALAEQHAVASEAYREACRSIGKPGLAAHVPGNDGETAAVLKAVLSEPELARWKMVKRGKALSPSVAKPEMRKAAHHAPIAALIDLAEARILRSQFGETLPLLISPVTGRLHPHYQIAGAPTGRATCSGPNIQGTPRDKRFRAMFIAADGFVFVGSDYSAMDMRTAAYFFADPELIAVFARGDDPHTITARKVLGKALDDLGEAERNEARSKAKAVNFGTIYGISASGLVEQAWKNYQLRLTLDEAQSLLDGFAAAYSALIQHRREYATRCQLERRIVIGLDWRRGRGRIIPFSRLESDQNPQTCSYAYPIQGLNADCSARALATLDRLLLEHKIDGGVAVWSHDEIVLEVRAFDAPKAAELLEQAMIDA